MKILVSIFLVVAILGSSLGKLLLYTNYVINKEEITRNYCENKSRPSLKCNGKCHLRKQLKAQENREKQQSKENTKEIIELSMFLQEGELNLATLSVNVIIICTHYISGITHHLPMSIFHPPIFSPFAKSIVTHLM